MSTAISPLPRQRFHLIFPLLITTVGVVLLLIEAGVISSDSALALIQLWPLVLVLLGTELVIEHLAPDTRGRLAAAVLMSVIIAVSVAGAMRAGLPGVANWKGETSAPISGATSGDLVLNLGGGQVTIGGDATATDLYRASYQLWGSPDVRTSGSQVTINTSRARWNWFGGPSDTVRLHLNPSIPWHLTLNAGAANLRVDLATVQLSSMEVNSGASTVAMVLGQPSGTVPIEIRGGAMNVTVRVPGDTQAQVSSSGALTNFESPGGANPWQTAGYLAAQNRYQVTLAAATSHIRVEWVSRMSQGEVELR